MPPADFSLVRGQGKIPFTMPSQNYHRDQPIFSAGEPLENARAAMIMLHGRGASAQDILSLAEYLPRDGFCFLAPQAANATWYPYRFMEPMEKNEPWLSSALELLDNLVQLVHGTDIPDEKIFLLGFSQGACLTLEYCARHAQKYGGIIGLSGGLIGPDDTPRNYKGSLDHTPVFLGCSDVDFHIPKERVTETRDVFARMGADVTMRLYPNMEHTVNEDELAFAGEMIKKVMGDL